jgi:ElaB/YqjD/DUF883 family membrane-anchored ribosome-binding protein
MYKQAKLGVANLTHRFMQSLEGEMEELLAALPQSAGGYGSWFGGGYSLFAGGNAADAKRAAAYATTLDVNQTLNHLSDELKDVVAAVNKHYETAQDEPLEQIRQTLDNQMTSLQHIQQQAREAISKADQLIVAANPRY